MSKSRMAPIKFLTLTKLKLMAAVTVTRLAKFVRSSLLPNCPPIQPTFGQIAKQSYISFTTEAILIRLLIEE